MLQIVPLTISGFQTTKGDLIRSIMFPKPMDFKFYQDAIRFIIVLACIACIGMAFTVYIMIKDKVRIQ